MGQIMITNERIKHIKLILNRFYVVVVVVLYSMIHIVSSSHTTKKLVFQLHSNKIEYSRLNCQKKRLLISLIESSLIYCFESLIAIECHWEIGKFNSGNGEYAERIDFCQFIWFSFLILYSILYSSFYWIYCWTEIPIKSHPFDTNLLAV